MAHQLNTKKDAAVVIGGVNMDIWGRPDGALVMGNMMNAAHALGLGSCWINRARQEFETDEGKAILKSLGIEGDYEGIGHLIVGYPDGDAPKPAPRKPGRVYWAE